MKTFIFIHKHSSAIMTISAPTFKEAEEELFSLLKSDYGWYVEDEEGEEEY